METVSWRIYNTYVCFFLLSAEIYHKEPYNKVLEKSKNNYCHGVIATSIAGELFEGPEEWTFFVAFTIGRTSNVVNCLSFV